MQSTQGGQATGGTDYSNASVEGGARTGGTDYSGTDSGIPATTEGYGTTGYQGSGEAVPEKKHHGFFS